jgi:hypothetical protein
MVSKRTTEFTLAAYTNAYWVGSVDDRKSTSGVAFLLEKMSCVMAK